MVKKQKGAVAVSLLFLSVFALMTFLAVFSIARMTMIQNRINDGVEAASLAENTRIGLAHQVDGYEGEWGVFSNGEGSLSKEFVGNYLRFYSSGDDVNVAGFSIFNRISDVEGGLYQVPITDISIDYNTYTFFDKSLWRSNNERTAATYTSLETVGTDMAVVADFSNSMDWNEFPLDTGTETRLSVFQRVFQNEILDKFFDVTVYNQNKKNRLAFFPFALTTVDFYPSTSARIQSSNGLYPGEVCTQVVNYGDYNGIDGDTVNFSYYTTKKRGHIDLPSQPGYPYIKGLIEAMEDRYPRDSNGELLSSKNDWNSPDFDEVVDIAETLESWFDLPQAAQKLMWSPQITRIDNGEPYYYFNEDYYANYVNNKSELVFDPEKSANLPFFSLTCRSSSGRDHIEKTYEQYQDSRSSDSYEGVYPEEDWKNFYNIYLSDEPSKFDDVKYFVTAQGTAAFNGLIRAAQALYIGKYLTVEDSKNGRPTNFDELFNNTNEPIYRTNSDIPFISDGVLSDQIPSILVFTDGEEYVNRTTLDYLILGGICDSLREKLPGLRIGVVGIGFDPAEAGWANCIEDKYLDTDLTTAENEEELAEFVDNFMRVSSSFSDAKSSRLYEN